MVQQWDVIEVTIDGRTFWVRPVGSWVLNSDNVVSDASAVSLDKFSEWAIGFLFGNTDLSLELWNIVAGISWFDSLALPPDINQERNHPISEKEKAPAVVARGFSFAVVYKNVDNPFF